MTTDQDQHLRPSIIRRVLRVALLSVVVITLVVGACELAFRSMWGNNGIAQLLDFEFEELPCVSLRPDVAVRHTGLFAKIDPVIHSVNHFGYRGQVRGPIKPRHEHRIIVVGDSFTFCPGVPEGEDYPSRLENHLNRMTRRDHGVLNFGVPSHNLRELQAHVERDVWKFSPDILVVQISQNDFSPTVCELTGEHAQYIWSCVHRSYLARLLVTLSLTATQRYEDPTDARLRKLDAFAADLAQQARAHDTTLRVTSFDEPVECGVDCVSDLFARHSVPYFPFPDDLRGHLRVDMGHLDSPGCDRYAQRLAMWLVETKSDEPVEESPSP